MSEFAYEFIRFALCMIAGLYIIFIVVERWYGKAFRRVRIAFDVCAGLLVVSAAIFAIATPVQAGELEISQSDIVYEMESGEELSETELAPVDYTELVKEVCSLRVVMSEILGLFYLGVVGVGAVAFLKLIYSVIRQFIF